MNRKLIFLILVLALFLEPVVLSAKEGGVDSMLDQMISNVSVDKPGIYKSANMTTFSGGGGSFRLKGGDAFQLPAISYQTPSATISCAGADINAGMLSIMNLDHLGSMLKNGGQSLAWGIMVGIMYSMPGVGNTFDILGKFSRFMQMLGANSCAIGKGIGKGIGKEIGKEIGLPDWWAKKKQDAGELAAGLGRVTSPLTDFMKGIDDFIKVDSLFNTYPYSFQGFQQLDKDMQDLVASFFGVFETYVKDKDKEKSVRLEYNKTSGKKFSELCPSASGDNKDADGKVCSASILGFFPHKPILKSLDSVLYGYVGDDRTLFDCGELIGGRVCKNFEEDGVNGGGDRKFKAWGKPGEPRKGLVPKIATKLEALVEQLSKGRGLDYYYNAGDGEGSLNELAAFTQVLPSLPHAIEYAIIMRRAHVGFSQDIASLDAASEMIAVLLMREVLTQMKYEVSTLAGRELNVVDNGGAINNYLAMLDANAPELDKKVKGVTEKYAIAKQAYDIFLSNQETLDQTIKQRVGAWALTVKP